METKNNNRKPRRKPRKRVPLSVMRMRRAIGLGIFFTLCFCGLIFQIWLIQHRYSEDYGILAARARAFREINRTHAIFTPQRGGFVDRHMQPITETQRVFTVHLDVEALHLRDVSARRANADTDVVEEALLAITAVLDVNPSEILEMLRTDGYGNLLMTYGRHHQILQRYVPAEIALPLEAEVREIGLTETSLRRYPDANFAPQVVGFLRGGVAWGLEAFYGTELAGEQGRNLWVSGETETVPVRDGFTIVTTLDRDIQNMAQRYANLMFERHPSRHAGVIVMQPFTGEILAMAQAPTFSLADPFNPDYFTCPHLVEVWPYLTYAQRTDGVMMLWRNMHTTRSSEPGSTFKPFVIAAAIEEGIITPNQMFTCEGRRQISDQTVFCHSRYGCGSMNLRRALYRSCNLAMVDINHAMGRDLFYRYRGYFGFGERTGIDLPGEEAVSSPLVMYPWSMLHAVEMATSSMGQGFNATTMQMINGYAALINGGNLMRPFLVSHIVDNMGGIVQETEPTVVRRVISQETSDFIRTEMRYVVSNNVSNPAANILRGTGWMSYIPGHSIGGKTGTAQQGRGEYDLDSLTYITFFPVENPQFLILMTIDHIEEPNRSAGDTIAPIKRDFILELIAMKNIQPADDADIAEPLIQGTPMPDFSGQRVSEAVSAIINMDTAGGFQVIGGGTIIDHHWPPAGHPRPETSSIMIFTYPDTQVPGRMMPVPDVTGLTVDTANGVLTAAGFPSVTVTDRVATDGDDFHPHTAHPQPVITDDEYAPPPVVMPYIVHQQFPDAGTILEMGTQVMIRAR